MAFSPRVTLPSTTGGPGDICEQTQNRTADQVSGAADPSSVHRKMCLLPMELLPAALQHAQLARARHHPQTGWHQVGQEREVVICHACDSENITQRGRTVTCGDCEIVYNLSGQILAQQLKDAREAANRPRSRSSRRYIAPVEERVDEDALPVPRRSHAERRGQLRD